MEKQYYNQLLENNREWVQSKLDLDPNFFKKSAEGQHPPLLWIGCADSRVPANEIIGAKPGEVFVHRNIANMAVHTDLNMISVLDYAVNVLKVKDIIVCGHYGCGGVNAALTNQYNGIVDKWIRHIKDVYRLHKDELDAIGDDKQKFNRFVELNVMEQANDLAKTSIVQRAWSNNQELSIHGWVYGLDSGMLKDLEVDINSANQLDEVYRLKF